MTSANIKINESSDMEGANLPERGADNRDEEKSSANIRVLMQYLPELGPYKKYPEIWFWKVEAAFGLAEVTDQNAMANAVVTLLDQETMMIVCDLVRRPDPVAPYKKLKDRIITSYSSSAEAKLRKLLACEIDANCRPTQLLAKMRLLNDGSCNEQMLKYLFVELISPKCRRILDASKITGLQELANLADIVEDTLTSTDVRGSNGDVKSLSGLHSKIDKLANKVDNLALSINNTTRSRACSRSSSRLRRRRSQSRGKAGLCWYHKRFGNYARECMQPCNWI